MLYQTTCNHCGKYFMTMRKDKKFCSSSCKTASSQLKKRGHLKRISDDLGRKVNDQNLLNIHHFFNNYWLGSVLVNMVEEKMASVARLQGEEDNYEYIKRPNQSY